MKLYSYTEVPNLQLLSVNGPRSADMPRHALTTQSGLCHESLPSSFQSTLSINSFPPQKDKSIPTSAIQDISSLATDYPDHAFPLPEGPFPGGLVFELTAKYTRSM